MTEHETAISNLIQAISTIQPHVDALVDGATEGDSTAYELIHALEHAAENMVETMIADRHVFEILYADARKKALTASTEEKHHEN